MKLLCVLNQQYTGFTPLFQKGLQKSLVHYFSLFLRGHLTYLSWTPSIPIPCKCKGLSFSLWDLKLNSGETPSQIKSLQINSSTCQGELGLPVKQLETNPDMCDIGE